MRTAIAGLVVIPVLVAGGLGIAAAVGVIDTPSPDSPRPADSSTAAPPSAASGLGGGTAIEGTRPHLSVIDGRATLMLPGALPAMLSVVSDRPIFLNALPTGTERDQPASRTVDKAPADRAPADRAPASGSRKSEVPRLQDPTVSAATDGDEWAIPTAQAVGGAAQSLSQDRVSPYANGGDTSGVSNGNSNATDNLRSSPR